VRKDVILLLAGDNNIPATSMNSLVKDSKGRKDVRRRAAEDDELSRIWFEATAGEEPRV
jgi:hypothetical protein